MDAHPTNPPLLKVSYCSVFLIPPDTLAAELHQLLVTARLHNAAFGITGVLRFQQGCFFQTFEGPPGAVRQLLTRITADSRHGNVTIFENEAVAKRQYDRWSMAFVASADALGDLSGILVDQVFDPDRPEDEHHVLSHIEAFCARLNTCCSNSANRPA